ncbi:MAG: UDP-N-acetylmuramoyl-tripeptide--D-alanyl-D-alanine ligase, partial [Acidobacteriaceae bacterium]|nr:UDP-N-acetylmuramoyl-tripeptide--D-alanyl-D-alanine ligase [Acidobacteriaceae bacterium]
MQLTLGEVATATGAIAQNIDLSLYAAGWSIDSRTAAAGELFFAIEGDVHDGHRFVQEVIGRGAIGAVVRRDYESNVLPLLRVPDTLGALQESAAFARRKWNGRVVGVTGSAGKTGTKDIIAELLGTKYRVGKTVGNFNNHIGLPLSVLRIPCQSEIGVFELGMNHAGEIRALARIAQPHIGVVTNVGYAHVEFFESIDGIAAAKRELIEALPENGTAILNADDHRVVRFRDSHTGRSITYGFSEGADVRATEVHQTRDGAQFTV